jgi:tRNA G18 (ribose-2'-O)-methylase SpoU
MNEFIHLRHKPPAQLEQPRQLIVACAPMRSNVNLSRIVRAASCCGVTRILAAGRGKIDPKIARDGADTVQIDVKRTLVPGLRKFKEEGYRIIGLEQTVGSQNIHEYQFPCKAVLVIGNERQGITEDILAELDDVIEIPVWGPPHSYNAATAAMMALYEYCRQFPNG